MRWLLGPALSALLVSACAAPPTQTEAAGTSSEPRVLHMGSPYVDPDGRYTPAIPLFTQRLHELSAGQLRVKLAFDLDGVGDYWAALPEGEQEVVRAVASGQLDLGWAGTRVFDTLGAPAVSALQAPFVVDSYALQAKVLTEPVGRAVLGELAGAGVEGLSLLAGGLRRPMSVRGPMRDPDEWRGKTVQHYRSSVAAATVRALGAQPTDVVSAVRDEGLQAGTIDGHEHALRNYVLRKTATIAPFVNDVVLWPETLALFATPDLDLDASQQRWLRQAATEASAQSVALMDTDDEQARKACEQGAKFVAVTPGQRAALVAATVPVLKALRTDPASADILDRLEALKATVPPAPSLDVPASCRG